MKPCAAPFGAEPLAAQREFRDNFLRVGYFLPNFQGVTRQPRAPGSLSHTTVGMMAGSSDSLAIDSRAPSLYPVYVTANREGTVEVFRDGSLIQTSHCSRACRNSIPPSAGRHLRGRTAGHRGRARKLA